MDGVDGLGDLVISLLHNCGLYELGSIAVGFFAWRVALDTYCVPYIHLSVVQTDVKA